MPDRWTLTPNFGLHWNIATDPNLPHSDTIEMSGRKVSLIAHYGIEENGALLLERMVVFPTLRTLPNDTHASLRRTFSLEESTPTIRVGGKPISPEHPYSVRLDGLLTIRSKTAEGLEITRILFPSASRLAALETWWIENQTDRALDLEFDPLDFCENYHGGKGVYLIEISHTAAESGIRLQPGETYTFGLAITGRGVLDPLPWPKVQSEEDNRRDFVARLNASLRFECPDAVLTRAFDFAKLRAAESVFDTASGLMHSPGGGAYYAAMWCNDQCEYANPFFPFLGDKFANQAALNCFRLFHAFMGPDYQPIPSSVIAEGQDFWRGAGDRGDAAMFAYGAARFALASGSQAVGAELWHAIAWCLEYCQRQLTPDGVVASDSDELEGRFSTGKTNLATSALTYGALRSAANLARALIIGGKPTREEPPDYLSAAQAYDHAADDLAVAIERFFGAEIAGYATYRYHEGLDLLRSWICLPLVMGIRGREAATLAALFSPALWTDDGLRTQAGEVTFWDRSTLYGFRGAFCAGEGEALTQALALFQAYSRRRLQGDHVPYPVEAFPEGGQRQLAAESALYCRVVSEGLFGITPTALNAFTCRPRLPKDWEFMALRGVKAFNRDFDVIVTRLPGGELHLRVEIQSRLVFDQVAEEGTSFAVTLAR
jgi:hypothetical protein